MGDQRTVSRKLPDQEAFERWLAEHCERKPGEMAWAPGTFAHWCAFAEEHGVKTGTPRGFRRQMASAGYGFARLIRRKRTGFYADLRLRWSVDDQTKDDGDAGADLWLQLDAHIADMVRFAGVGKFPG